MDIERTEKTTNEVIERIKKDLDNRSSIEINRCITNGVPSKIHIIYSSSPDYRRDTSTFYISAEDAESLRDLLTSFLEAIDG